MGSSMGSGMAVSTTAGSIISGLREDNSMVDRKNPDTLFFSGEPVIYALPEAGTSSEKGYGLRTIKHPISQPMTTVLESSWIVSIMPFKEGISTELRMRIPIHRRVPGGLNIYTLPPAQSTYGKNWEFVAIPVFSTIIGFMDKRDINESDQTVTLIPENSQAVCQVLLDAWVKPYESPNGGHPGIGRVPPGVTIPGPKVHKDKWQPEFRAFVESLVIAQNKYFQWLVEHTSEQFRKYGLNRVHEKSRVAARWVYGNAADQLPWMSVVDVLANKVCGACSRPIRRDVAVCTECRTNLLEYYLNPYSGLSEDWVKDNDPDLHPRYLIARDAIKGLGMPFPGQVQSQPQPPQQQGKR